jgi:FAD/FMN-containing dehydrogenase
MTSATVSEGLDRIREIVGDDNFSVDAEELRYLSQDYFNAADPVTAAIRPTTTQSLAEAVAVATDAGIAIFQRGGGYSYTDAYLPTQWPSISIDTRGLDQIIEINQQDMYVTVEAGCTWAMLDEALAKLGLRVPCAGPQSGLRATIGGGVSQGALGHGSARSGLSTESVLGMEVVLADGTTLITGSAAQPQHSAFFRFYGPDVTGLFCQDSGALGIKATITLRLQKRPALTDGLSFVCDTFAQASQAMARVAGEGLAAENFGMSSALVAHVIETRRLKDNIRTLGAVGQSGAGYLDGLSRMLRLVLTGRRLGSDQQETIHFGLDATNRQIMKGQIAAVRGVVGHLGREMPNSIPIARRAEPFPDHPMLSPLGQRQLPFHAIFPFSQAAPFHNALQAFLATRSTDMERHRMGAVSVYSATSTNGFLYEPVFQWPDVPDIFHRRHTPSDIIARADRNEPNPPARLLARELKDRVVELMFEHGGVHLQIGKTYPYLADRDPRQTRLLSELKNAVDPQHLINPGALGLPLRER